jgi:pyrroline-5-carboxylate reductase
MEMIEGILYCRGLSVAEVREIFSALGEILVVEAEADLDAVTAVSGSGPAYLFGLAEDMQRAGEAAGLSRDAAGKLVRQTLYGAAALLKSSPLEAEELRRQVTSPGGTTEAAFKILDQGGWGAALRAAVAAARVRAREMALS